MNKHLTKISDLNKEDISKIINKAFEFKEKAFKGEKINSELKGKSIAMIFEKASLRTKAAFQIAAYELGANSIFLPSTEILASGNNEKGRESVADIAKNLERFCDLILARVYSHETIQNISQNTSKPVINALCNKHHPTQALADLMTIIWHKKTLDNLKVCFIGDGNNVATSLMQICALMGINFSIASPLKYQIPKEFQKEALEIANKSKSKIEFLENPEDAVKDSDVVYTDTFVSMGQEEEKAKRLKNFKNYQVNMKLFKKAKPNAIFMHCLPAHRGEEVTDKVMDCANSVIFDQAEARLYIAKSLLCYFLA